MGPKPHLPSRFSITVPLLGLFMLVAHDVLAAQSITYVGKRTTTSFVGYGQHLQYWPLFGLTSGQTARRTDDPSSIELTPSFASFKHHYLPVGRTFSNDALGEPIGTKTRGGYATWATFTLPDGRTGRSGTFYDESNIDNSNNTINEMRINVSTLTSFCLNLITDNTNREHDPNVILEARSDDVDLSLAGHPDLTFDGQTDMYTFRYDGMKENNVVKVRFQCSKVSGCKGAGLGGVMVSDISTCNGTANQDAGATPPSGKGNGNGDGDGDGDGGGGGSESSVPPASSPPSSSQSPPSSSASGNPAAEPASGGCQIIALKATEARAAIPMMMLLLVSAMVFRRHGRHPALTNSSPSASPPRPSF